MLKYAFSTRGAGIPDRGNTTFSTRRPSYKRKMPKYRRTFGYSNGTKRRGAGGYTSTLKNAQNLARLNKRIGGFAGLELLFLDNAVNYTQVANTAALATGEYDPATVLCLNAMIAGTGPSTRLGRTIHMKSITIAFQFDLAKITQSADVEGDVTVYVALVLDKQTNAAQLSSEDVFTNPGIGFSTAVQPFPNMENTDRFRVLKRRNFKMARAGVGMMGNVPSTDADEYSYGRVTKDFTWHVNLRNMKVLYDDTTGGTIANIRDKSLHVVCFCDVSGSGLAPKISYTSRLRYTTS